MKKSTLLLTVAITFMFFGCSEKSVTHLENDSNYLSSIPEEYVTETELESKGYLTEHQDISGKVDKSEPKKEKSINEILAELLLAEFQDDLGSWSACVVYDGKEYTSLDDFLNRDK